MAKYQNPNRPVHTLQRTQGPIHCATEAPAALRPGTVPTFWQRKLRTETTEQHCMHPAMAAEVQPCVLGMHMHLVLYHSYRRHLSPSLGSPWIRWSADGDVFFKNLVSTLQMYRLIFLVIMA
jgi:hypothetical protein